MQIGIVGSDSRATQLATMLVRAGHGVTISDPLADERATRAANGLTGVTPLTPADQTTASDMLVFMLRSQEIDSALAAYGNVERAIVVETSRPASDGTKPSIAEQLGSRLGTKRIVKTFTDTLEPGEAVLVASDDTEAKAVVSGVIASVGMRAVDAGSLIEARRIERGTAKGDPIMH